MEAAMEEVEPEAIVVFMSLNYIAKIGISKQKHNFEDFFLQFKKVAEMNPHLKSERIS